MDALGRDLGSPKALSLLGLLAMPEVIFYIQPRLQQTSYTSEVNYVKVFTSLPKPRGIVKGEHSHEITTVDTLLTQPIQYNVHQLALTIIQ